MFKKFIVMVSLVFVLGLLGTASAELVGQWKLDEGSGASAADSSGYGNDGVLGGDASWDAGYFGGSLSIDGAGWVDIPPEAWNSIERKVTVAYWTFGGEGLPIACFTFGAWSADANPDRQASAAPWNGTMYWDTGYDGAYDRINKAIPEEFQKGEWTHWAFTKDCDAGEKHIYINGELFHSGTGMTRPMTGVIQFTIGTRATTDHIQGYIGWIDDFRLYNHVLSEDDVRASMENQGGAMPKAYSPTPRNGTLHEDTWISLGWRAGDFAVSHDVYIGDNFDAVSEGAEGTYIGNQTDTFFVVGFPGFPYPDGLVPGTTYYWRIDEVNEAEPNSPWKGDIWSFSIPPKTAYFPDPADDAEGVSVEPQLSWTPGYGAKLHTVYFGETFEEVDTAAGGSPQGTAAYTPGILKMAKTYYWRVDEFDVVETHKGDVWSFTTEGAVSSPNPAKGAVDVTQAPVLTWTPGLGATYDIYFGTDPGTLEKKASDNLGEESYEPGQLEWNTTYYWRVDEANSANSDSPWIGPTWSFTTANFLIIDDFEAYNDLDPDDPLSNRIFNAWLDGYDDPTNGSLVGNDMAPFAEQDTVHSGLQSMPMFYDNSAAAKSEATLTLTSNRDWTVNGVTTLTIWFRGESSNAAVQMYVTLNGTAKVDNDNPDAATITRWTPWNIELQKFADQGVNLSNVNSITLGLSSVTGGTGTMYFDDIRLYPPAP
jgi:hypothetical protein